MFVQVCTALLAKEERAENGIFPVTQGKKKKLIDISPRFEKMGTRKKRCYKGKGGL